MTGVERSDRMQPKLNRLDRGAGFISTLRQGQAAAGWERENRRSRENLPGLSPLGRRRTSAGLSQDFVKRYQWPSDARCGRFPDFHGPLDKAVQFLSPGGDGNAGKLFGKVGYTMKKLLSLVMAMAMILSLAACGGSKSEAPAETPAQTETPAESSTDSYTGVEDGVLTVGMECAYAPYNWTQMDDSDGAVPISNVPGSYANGYDVMIAKKICEANGWELEVIQSDWDSLVPGVQTGTFDAVIAGQSMTAERAEQVDFAGPYFYATIVCVTKADSPYASATSIADLAGGSCTAQLATIWDDQCLPQIEGANIQSAAETAPAMLMALETDTVDFICTDMPTAQGAVAAYPDMVILDFSGTDGDFQFSEEVRAENVNIGVSLMKGNTVLREAIDSVLSTMTVDDFNALMAEAISIQPLSD